MKKINLFCMLVAFIVMSFTSHLSAQAVIFPQATKPGVAQGSEGTNQYTLSNQLLSATFAKENGTLAFKGCDGLSLVGGTELFTLTFGDGSVVKASQMKLGSVKLERLVGEPSAVKGSHRFDGYALKAQFTYQDLTIDWAAVLRDESHYLRTKMDITANSDVQMKNLIPMSYNVDTNTGGQLNVVGNTRGAILVSDHLFAGLETPMGINTAAFDGETSSVFSYDSWVATSFKECPEVPDEILNLNSVVAEKNLLGKPTGEYSATGPKLLKNQIRYMSGKLQFKEDGVYTLTFLYKTGTHGLYIAGVDVLNENGEVVDSDYHSGFSGTNKFQHTYTLNNIVSGTYTIRYFVVETKGEEINSSGSITYSPNTVSNPLNYGKIQHIQGLWSRKTTLERGKTWQVSAVVGIVAPGQARRSILAYSERERAVPWRPMPIYNSWYELNIDRNNASDPTKNMTTEQTFPILDEWKKQLFDKYGVGIKSFVWDDGWDNYQTWECHGAFNFTEPAAKAEAIGAGTGVWLGPVGGYGVSGDTRRAYWDKNNRGGMRLSNPNYYKVFYNAVTNFVTQYNGNYFKLDGISDLPTAFGPKDSPTGEEDAELIIGLESHIRTLKPDIFLNTSVGTWASPFWFRYTDAVWRQLGDYDVIGDNTSDRERWTTYRDNLVHEHFVTESPLCPINTMMVHGFILADHYTTTGWGPWEEKHYCASTDWNYPAVLRELRCAFASGNAMQELYADFDLMNSINNGQLWADLAECIRWQEKNADVLPDIHWVGGDPWDGQNENIYGWASWNGKKATFALRNGDTQQKDFNITLREALDIPAYINGTITFQPSFKVQDALIGFTTGAPIDIDTPLKLTLPASSVYVFDGVQDEPDVPVEPEFTEVTCTVKINATDQYGTCILPFDAQLPASLKAYSCRDVQGNVLILTEETTLQANTPYILYAVNGANETFTGMVNLKEMPSEVSVGLLTGVLKETILEINPSRYVLQNQGKGARFYKVDKETITLPANKCFLTVQASKEAYFLFGGDATGIQNIGTEEDSNAPIYDLAGRRVQETIPGTIYIRNGKKFLAE